MARLKHGLRRFYTSTNRREAAEPPTRTTLKCQTAEQIDAKSPNKSLPNHRTKRRQTTEKTSAKTPKREFPLPSKSKNHYLCISKSINVSM